MTGRAPILVLAVGNPSRGDDAIGPLLAARLEAARGGDGRSADLEVLCEPQLMVEHTLDVVGRAAVIFVDAAASGPGEVHWRSVTPAKDGLAVSSHACSPGQLLRLVEGTLGEPSPPSFLLSVGGHDFELGAPLQAATARALEVAWGRLVQELSVLGVALAAPIGTEAGDA